MNYAKGLHEARVRAGMSKRRLAQLAEVDPSYITHIEAGRRKPSLDAIEKLAKILGVPVPVLMLFSAEQADLNGIGEGKAKELAALLATLAKD